MSLATSLWASSRGEKVDSTVKEYNHLFKDASVEDRQSNYAALVNQYYDLSTDFYEYGWGTSFHFAPRGKNESLAQSIARHEQWLALRLGLKPGMKVLDVGCGVGGPMMEIARFSGAQVTGVNNNSYQISRGYINLSKAGLSNACNFLKADFMHVPVEDCSFDAIYAIEATCHAPSKVGIYSEIFRMLKPGCYFAAYEWLLTDLFNPDDPKHQEAKRLIEIGDGLPNLDTIQVALDALKEAGFEIVESKDLAVPNPANPIPWYQPLVPGFSLTGWRTSGVGIWITHILVNTFERLKILPQGVTQSHTILTQAAQGLVSGGKSGIFTPMYFMLARKPLS